MGGVCVNTVGSYYCSCPPPLVLDDTQRNCVNSSHLTIGKTSTFILSLLPPPPALSFTPPLPLLPPLFGSLRSECCCSCSVSHGCFILQMRTCRCAGSMSQQTWCVRVLFWALRSPSWTAAVCTGRAGGWSVRSAPSRTRVKTLSLSLTNFCLLNLHHPKSNWRHD